ncbi:uncharacterized protein CC84DRAFT_516921 [Paraphaeosphaeria sporulosa]|uniref:Uncharacterized protein n=1 Tax=Paraphaeosphaeria sporulosa TaxID=1460663 RepID=A0A177CU39_9PLEO|nr:uncharacterized protein CC84DRAFT_516921 [Paraphaeosphaeria sporulosa]OAG11033.1 hypothetical protein CC84DRAFT_516921 [Paraphaeosphaeria sporulosa]
MAWRLLFKNSIIVKKELRVSFRSERSAWLDRLSLLELRSSVVGWRGSFGLLHLTSGVIRQGSKDTTGSRYVSTDTFILWYELRRSREEAVWKCVSVGSVLKSFGRSAVVRGRMVDAGCRRGNRRRWASRKGIVERVNATEYEVFDLPSYDALIRELRRLLAELFVGYFAAGRTFCF